MEKQKIKTISFDEFLEEVEERSVAFHNPNSSKFIEATVDNVLKNVLAEFIKDFDILSPNDRQNTYFKLDAMGIPLNEGINSGELEFEMRKKKIPTINQGLICNESDKSKVLKYIKETYKGIIFKGRFKR